MLTGEPMVSIVISNYNGVKSLVRCLKALLGMRYRNFEVVVVDSNSSDGSQEMIRARFPEVRLISLSSRVGIGEALNIGVLKSRGEYVVVDLNNDDVVSEDWLSELVGVIERSENIGIVAGKRYLGDTDKLDSAGGRYAFGLTMAIGHARNGEDRRYENCYEVDYVPVLLLRKKLFEELGLLDTEYYIYGEDTDFCLRAKLAGYRILYVPGARYRHARSSTIGEASPRRLYYLFRSRFRLMIKFVPVYKLVFFLLAHTFIFSIAYSIYYAAYINKEKRNCLEYFAAVKRALADTFFNLKWLIMARYNVQGLRAGSAKTFTITRL